MLMPKVQDIGSTNFEPWVIVWTSKQDDPQPIPSPFARGSEGRCQFEKAIDLAQNLAPPERVAPVVLRPQRPWWIRPLGAVPTENLAEQPFDRGSAPGVLLAVLRVYRKDPSARVVLLGASSEPIAFANVDEALEQVGDRDDIVVLAQAPIGRRFRATCGEPVTAYRRVDGEWRIGLRAGEVRGDGIIVATARALLQLFSDTQPELTEQFLTTLTGPSLFDEDALDQLYPFLPNLDFQAEVLARAPNALSALVRSRPRAKKTGVRARGLGLS